MKKLLLLVLLLIISPAYAKTTLLIMGDSLSAAYGMDVKLGWVKLLEEKFSEEGYTVSTINMSISGETLSNGLAKLPAALALHQPTLTIIELGGNDGLRGTPISTIKQNLAKVIDLTLKANSKVLILGVRLPVNLGEAYSQQFQQIFVDLAQQEDIKVIPSFLHGIDENPKLMQKDGIHPTQEAQPMMLTTVWPELKTLSKN